MQIRVPAVNYLKAVRKLVKRNPTVGRKATMHGKILLHHSMREELLAEDAGFALGDLSTLFYFSQIVNCETKTTCSNSAGY